MDQIIDPHAGQPVRTAGEPLEKARAAVILLHGRGAGAADILSLAGELAVPGLAYLAPEAAGGVWYPYSFLSPLEKNQPWLDSALATLARLSAGVEARGLPTGRIAWLGFSQGACLALEYAVRFPQPYGAVIAFSGGLIGPPGQVRHDQGDLAGTPVYIGCSDHDPYIPAERVRFSAANLQRLGAQVNAQFFPGMPHTINRQELETARGMLRALTEGEG